MSPAVLLVAALATAPVAATLQVTARDPRGAPAPAFAAAISRALVVTGATVVEGPEAPKHCGAGCVSLTVLRRGPGHFEIEARRAHHVAHVELTLSDTAPAFDAVQAVAVQARLLVADLPPSTAEPRMHAAPTPLPPHTVAPPERPEPNRPPPPGVDAIAGASRSRPDGRLIAQAAAHHPIAADSPAGGPQTVVLEQPPPAPAARRRERLAVDLTGAVLGGLGRGMFTYGVALHARVGLFAGLRLEAAAGMLESTRGHDVLGPFRARVRPISASVDIDLPWVPGLSAGLGAEAVSLEIERVGELTELQLWSGGALARAAYVLPLGPIGVTASAHVALHPHTGHHDADQGYQYPLWSWGADVGLHFHIL